MFTSKIFRIFISSTFSDFKEERNALQTHVFPKLRQLCMEHGFRFQAIDLRWGVRQEAALDQQTVRICLDEIQRCQKITPKPNFIVLLGDRYGWQPLPAEIPAKEFEALLPFILDGKDKKLLLKWYKRDDNTVPPVYNLQPRTLGDQALNHEASEAEKRDWSKTERTLQMILRKNIENLQLSEDQKIKYHSSATEQEIRAGALAVPYADEHVFAFFRQINNIPEDGRTKDFSDLTDHNSVDMAAQNKLNNLKTKLADKIGKDHVFTYQADWTGTGSTTHHIAALCEDVYRSLSSVISAEIHQFQERDDLDQEIDTHEVFCQERSRVFVGRMDELKAIQDYIGGCTSKPFAIWGDSGSGKSALIAAAVQQVRRDHPQASILYRFTGATPASSDIRSLLGNLCRQIARLYNTDEMNIPGDYVGLVSAFSEQMEQATEEKPLIIFLDALDQLSFAENARNLIWLPRVLPQHVHLIVSTLPVECLTILEKSLPQSHRIKIEPMSIHEGEKLLTTWLEQEGRILQEVQKDDVLHRFAQNGLPLYLKLAFEEARRWKSYQNDYRIGEDVYGMIRCLFARLSSDANHGEMIVTRSLGYLAAAKNGLTEDELLDLLSRDEEVYQDFVSRSFHKPPAKRLPVVLWSRLYFDLAPYLSERNADGTSLMDFYHRQLREVVLQTYLHAEDGKKRHQHLAEYFAEQPLEIKGIADSLPNLRKMSELPYQQTHGEMWDDLFLTLTNFQFLQQKATYVGVSEIKNEHGDKVKQHTGIHQVEEDFLSALRHISGEDLQIGGKRQPIFVTPIEVHSRLFVRCPKCDSEHPCNVNWLDQIIKCPTESCPIYLKVNPFTVQHSKR